MRFDLLLTNPRRVRWLLWGMVVGYGLGLAMVGLKQHAAFWWLVALPLVVLGLLPFWDQLFRQPAWVLVAADSIAWANPADSPPVRCSFAELRAYRFESNKLDSKLLLCPLAGKKIVLSGQLHQEFSAMQLAFKQALAHYNRTHPGAEVVPEKDLLARFFERRASTNVLLGLLAAGIGLVVWGEQHDADPVLYAVPGFVLIAYLATWTSFHNERTRTVPVVPIATTATFNVWLINSGRNGWWRILLVILFVIGGLPAMMTLLEQLAPTSQFLFWVGLGLWLSGALAGMVRFFKWASDPASIILEADRLIVRIDTTAHQAIVPFAEIKDYSSGSFRGNNWLRIEWHNGSKTQLHAMYSPQIFRQMAADFERRFKMYHYQHRPPRPASRR